MSVDHLYFEWWIEGGWVWVRHDCNGTIKEWHPDSRWKASVDGVQPSFQCDDCGRHTILTMADYKDHSEAAVSGGLEVSQPAPIGPESADQ